MLARIEGIVGVDEAWISRDGAFVVVEPRKGADVDEAVHAVLAEERTEVFRLEGTNLATVLALFEDERRDWMRGAGDTDALTRIEADIVGERIAARVAAKVALRPSERRAIERVVARDFYRAVARGEDVDPAVVPAELAGLGGDARQALLDAVAQGFRPLDGER